MPLIQPDFSEVLEALPEGTYQAKIVDAEVKQSKAGNTYVRWQMSVFGADDTRCNGKSVWHSTPVTGKGAFRLQQLVKAGTGVPASGQFDTSDLMGRDVLITVVDGIDQNGEKSGYPEVKAVRTLQ